MTDSANLIDQIAAMKAEIAQQQEADRERGTKARKRVRWPWQKRAKRIPIVSIALDGRVVRLNPTWARIDKVGTRHIDDLFQIAAAGNVGGMAALAEILEIFTGGEITQAQVYDGGIAMDLTFSKALEAWMMAKFGPPKSAAQNLWDRWAASFQGAPV